MKTFPFEVAEKADLDRPSTWYDITVSRFVQLSCILICVHISLIPVCVCVCHTYVGGFCSKKVILNEFKIKIYSLAQEVLEDFYILLKIQI